MTFTKKTDPATPDRFPSLWAATAAQGPASDPLMSSRRADVLIIGGGYTGLSTALHLAEYGVDACVLEAQEPGWGASGRNGGQVIPGLKHDPETLVSIYGKTRAEPLIDLVGGAADAVFDLIARYGIECDPVRAGWIQPAHSLRMLETLADRARQWRERGAPVEVLDRDAVCARLGTDAFVGGWVDRRAGSIHPLNYARGLARVAQSLGASVHGTSRVTRLERIGDQWQATVASGVTVRAPHVVIATNGYTDELWPRLKQSILPANSFIVATRPLPSNLGAGILPGGEVASDSKRLLLYFRRDAYGRFILGGRGPFREPTSSADWSHLIRSVHRLYPALQGIPFEFRWSGRVAVTRDFIPHVHEPEPGVMIAMGYNGRGVAMATQIGRHIAMRIAGRGEFPFPITDLKPIPLHGLRRFYISAGVAYYGFRDLFS